MSNLDFLKQKLQSQAHIWAYMDRLSEEERRKLSLELAKIDVDYLNHAFQQTLKPAIPSSGQISPIPKELFVVKKDLDDQKKNYYWNLGLKAISQGQVAAIVMAGGQATRLGASEPKGTIKLSMNISEYDSLLWMQGAKIRRLIKLARKKYPGSKPRLPWLIMTSKSTHDATVKHVQTIAEDLMLPMDDIILFEQAEIPCFDFDGKFLLNSKSSLATAPNGNGGLYDALKPLLPNLKSQGVKYFHIYCVDNILCRVADPCLIGCAIDRQADCTAISVQKSHPSEEVGVLCLEDDKIRVVEYSEIPKDLSEKRDPSGRLVLGTGSIAMHYFSMGFLEAICAASDRLPFHVAKKKIPYFDPSKNQVIKPDKPNGIKLEKFVFDAYPLAKELNIPMNFFVWEVLRHEEFAPLKNADHAGKDCPSTIRADFEKECRRWLAKAGIRPKTEGHVYLSPLLTYAGEDLAQRLKQEGPYIRKNDGTRSKL